MVLFPIIKGREFKWEVVLFNHLTTMSLYLKYRPADFKNLVWQSFVKDTLQKAIKDNKTVWAYLLCWPRWTGKTSTARIIAKAVNCRETKIDNFNLEAFKYTFKYLNKNLNISVNEYYKIISEIKYHESVKNFSDLTNLFLMSLGRFQMNHKNDNNHKFIDMFIYECDKNYEKLYERITIWEKNNHIHTWLSRFDIRYFDDDNLSNNFILSFNEFTKNKPCDLCNTCIWFKQWHLTDIIEIDAASNTWVDNIREIIEKAQFQPSKTKYKIYIIDEVHMLSKWAFNALLKILEEPPSHVKFILATTETHKVPETIISRCQRYDFKRISNTDVKERLEYIADAEWIKVDEKSIEYIIKNSAGWLRNAISLFEQLIFDSELNYENIVKKLEIVDEDIISTFLEKLLNKDSSVIEIFDKNIDDWKNIKLFIKELIYFTKAKTLNEIRLSNDVTKYIEILDTLDETYSKTRNSLDENTTFLIGILKLLNSYNTKKVVESVQVNNIVPAQSNSNQQNKEERSVKKVEENAISHDDLSDIFGWDEEVFDIHSSNKVEAVNESTWNTTRFDLTTFRQKLKDNWAKWWLVLALPAAKIELYWSTLSIWTSTKIHRSQFENVDNQNIILKSLSDMWIENINIKLN